MQTGLSQKSRTQTRLAVAIERLENHRWSRAAVSVSSALAQLNAMFVTRFEQPT